MLEVNRTAYPTPIKLKTIFYNNQRRTRKFMSKSGSIIHQNTVWAISYPMVAQACFSTTQQRSFWSKIPFTLNTWKENHWKRLILYQPIHSLTIQVP